MVFASSELSCGINGGIGDGDGVGIAGFGECGECGEIALSDGGGDDAGCFIREFIGLSSGGGAAVDGDVYIAEIADAIGGDSLDVAEPVSVLRVLASMIPVVLSSRALRTAALRVVSVRVTASSPRLLMPPESKAVLRSTAEPVSVVTAAASMATVVLPSRC